MPISHPPIAAGTRIGHVHLKVADLPRALDFYVGVLGAARTLAKPFQTVQFLGMVRELIGLPVSAPPKDPAGPAIQ